MLYKNREIRNFKAVKWHGDKASMEEVRKTFPQDIEEGWIQFQPDIHYIDADPTSEKTRIIGRSLSIKCYLIDCKGLLMEDRPDIGYNYIEQEVSVCDAIIGIELEEGGHILSTIPICMLCFFMQEQDESQSEAT